MSSSVLNIIAHVNISIASISKGIVIHMHSAKPVCRTAPRCCC